MRTRTMVPAGLALALTGGAATAQTVTHEFTFDGVPIMTPASSLAQPDGLGLGFFGAVFAPDENEFGEPIPGTERWRIDADAPAVVVDDPSRFGRGQAPSPTNALEALFQPVLLTFEVPFNLGAGGFSTVLDNDPFGDNGFLPGFEGIAVHFFDADFGLIERLPVDQTEPGFEVLAGGYANVGSILLPAGAFYDNLRISGTPVPGAGAGALLGLAGAVAARRRK